MTLLNDQDHQRFREAVKGLLRGDFSALAPLFDEDRFGQGKCRIIEWYEAGYFNEEPKALAEAFTCSCFLGRTSVAEFLLNHGVDPVAGNGTGMTAFHWAANRGQLDTVRFLIDRKAPLEIENMYGGTVLGTTLWSVINETKPEHVAIIQALLDAGAKAGSTDYPTGNERIDELLQRHRAKP